MCGNYSREETIQGRKLYEEIRYLFNRQGWYVTLANLTFLSIFLSKFKGQIRDYNLTFCACCMMMLVPRENRPPLYIVVDESSCRIISSKHTKLIILCSLKVSKELNHFRVIAGLFRQIGGHSSRFVLFLSFWRLFTIKMIKSVKVFPFSFWKIITKFFFFTL